MIDRLTGQDLWMFAPDEVGWPQDIGALALLDGAPLLEPDGTVPLDAVRVHVDRRLHLAPRLRKVVYRPGSGLGRPIWVDAPAFAIADHVHTRAIDPPADEIQLLRACEELRRQPLDALRPLWDLWLLTGMTDGRVGVYFRLHHALADGVAGVATIGALFDMAPDAPSPDPPRWRPGPIPTRDELRADTLRRRRLRATRTLVRLCHPVRSLDAALRLWSQLRAPLAAVRVTPTSLNRRVGRGRRLAIVGSNLADVKRVAHTHDATVNDVVLAAVAGGLRDLLQSRGEKVEDLVVRATVPVSLHRDLTNEPGNLDTMMGVMLPIGERDPVQRLKMITAETAAGKREAVSNPFTPLMAVRIFQRFAMRAWARQRLVNVYVTNVVGPHEHLYLAGMRLLDVFPIVPLGGNVTIGVGVLSYAGQLNLTVVADRDHCPDVEMFAAGVRRDLADLSSAYASGVDRVAPTRP